MKQMIVFVLFSALLCWIMFAPVHKHVVMVRQATLQKEADLLLEIGANGAHGYIGAQHIEASRQRLQYKGFHTGELKYTVETTSGLPGDRPGSPVPRGIGLQLTISYPLGRLFEIDRLIGIQPPDASTLLLASGIKMSEYVP